MLKSEDKLMDSLNVDIQNKIKEVRSGKNIIPEKNLEEISKNNEIDDIELEDNE